MSRNLLRTTSPSHIDPTVAIAARYADAPWVAAHFAVLNEAAGDIGLNVDFDILAAVRTRHNKQIVHADVFTSRAV